MKILVIDDKSNVPDYSRRKLLEVLEETEQITFNLIEPNEADLKSKLSIIEEYDLIIVDYKFDTSISPIFKTGASLYSLLRDYTKSIPIYLISVLTYNTNQIGDFDRFIKDEFISEHCSFSGEIRAHQALKTCSSVDDFKTLLGVPEDVEDDIDTMLKQFFNEDDSSTDVNEIEIPPSSVTDNLNIRLFRWLIQSLLHKEGPLVSKEGAALHLGISVRHFDEISEKFEEAKYSGLFSHSLAERWWISLLEDAILVSDDPEDQLSQLPFKEASSLLLGATNQSDFSSCVVCGDKYPDSLGIDVDDGDKKLLPVHVACSEFNESLKQEPFFRNPRLIEDD